MLLYATHRKINGIWQLIRTLGEKEKLWALDLIWIYVLLVLSLWFQVKVLFLLIRNRTKRTVLCYPVSRDQRASSARWLWWHLHRVRKKKLSCWKYCWWRKFYYHRPGDYASAVLNRFCWGKSPDRECTGKWATRKSVRCLMTLWLVIVVWRWQNRLSSWRPRSTRKERRRGRCNAERDDNSNWQTSSI